MRGKHTEPAEEGLSLVRGDRLDRQFQALADGLGWLTHRYAFFPTADLPAVVP